MRAERPEHAARLMRWATYASTATAVLLLLAKLVAWWMTDSLSLLGSLMDSSLDLLASLVNMVAVRHALEPADHEHRFGHGKAESLAGLAQATFVAGSAAFLVLQALWRLWRPQPLGEVEVGIGVMLLSIVATAGLVAFQTYVVRRTDSTAVAADRLHYKTDLLMNLGVIAALGLAHFGWPGFDALFALAIAAYIFHSAWEIARRALDHLMDRELPHEDRERIKAIVRAHPEVRGMHDLRTRRAGNAIFVQLHLELDDDLPLIEAHRIADEVEAEIRKAYPQAEVIIHEDPASLMEEKPPFADE